jgi:hypothetical protein
MPSNFFRSRHEIWLEREVERLRAERVQELERIEKAHAAELSRAIEENRSLRDELERTRIVLTPALQSVTLPKERDNTPPPLPEKIITGTPWQRVQAKYYADLDEQDKIKNSRFVKPVDAPVEGESNGNVREGRVETPLSKPS